MAFKHAFLDLDLTVISADSKKKIISDVSKYFTLSSDDLWSEFEKAAKKYKEYKLKNDPRFKSALHMLWLQYGNVAYKFEDVHEEYHRLNSEQIPVVYPDFFTFASECSNRDVDIFLLTAGTLEPRKKLLDKAKITEYFKRIFTEYDLNLSKDSPEFYKKVLDELGFDAKDCFFVDDNLQVLRAAGAVGLTTIAINRESSEMFTPDFKPDFVVNSLSKVFELL